MVPLVSGSTYWSASRPVCGLLAIGGTVDWGSFLHITARNRSVTVDFDCRRPLPDKMSPPPCLRRRGLGVVGDFSSFQVRGIANSKDSDLMLGLVHRRRSVRGHPKVRSELSAMEHQNFLFDIKGYVRRRLKDRSPTFPCGTPAYQSTKVSISRDLLESLILTKEKTDQKKQFPRDPQATAQANTS
ncbi:hypothetical protein BHE74_00028066 [Ensete ventricosum]|nr:hypothetical protein BHE74_00028066 [Ensete ventricosum]